MIWIANALWILAGSFALSLLVGFAAELFSSKNIFYSTAGSCLYAFIIVLFIASVAWVSFFGGWQWPIVSIRGITGA